MAIIPGDKVRLRTQGEVLSVEGNRALVQWSSGSVSYAYLKSLEHTDAQMRRGRGSSAEQRDPEAS